MVSYSLLPTDGLSVITDFYQPMCDANLVLWYSAVQWLRVRIGFQVYIVRVARWASIGLIVSEAQWSFANKV